MTLQSQLRSTFKRVTNASVLLTAISTACAHPPLPSEASQMLEDRAASATSEVVYIGDVFSAVTPDEGALFRYERRVDDDLVSHLTRTISGRPVVWQGVRISSEGDVEEMELIHAQLGLVANATVGDNAVTLTVKVGEGEEEVVAIETSGAVVVGPTLFQHLLRNRAALAAGIEFDFLSLENRGVYRFNAKTRDDESGAVVVRAVDPFVALLVSPLVIIYDDDTRQMVSYQGPVPPLLENGQTFEGLVHYSAEVPFR